MPHITLTGKHFITVSLDSELRGPSNPVPGQHPVQKLKVPIAFNNISISGKKSKLSTVLIKFKWIFFPGKHYPKSENSIKGLEK